MVGMQSRQARRSRVVPLLMAVGGLAVAAMAADVARSEALLRRFTPHPTNYFRFPGGCYDRAALRAIAPTGVRVIQYDVASGDAFGTSVRRIVTHTLAQTRAGSRSEER